MILWKEGGAVKRGQKKIEGGTGWKGPLHLCYMSCVAFSHSLFQSIVSYKSRNETIKRHKVGKQTLRHKKEMLCM